MVERKFIEKFNNIDVLFKWNKNTLFIRVYDMFKILYNAKGQDFIEMHKKVVKEANDDNMLENVNDMIEFEKESLDFFKDMFVSINSFINVSDCLDKPKQKEVFIWLLKIFLEQQKDNDTEININYQIDKLGGKLNIDVNIM